jgi:general secretion pathway protein G
MMKKAKKRALTLLEIMIVISLIIMITGAIGYNMRSTLDRGRAFRTEQARDQLEDLLEICLAEGASPDQIVNRPADVLRNNGLAKDPDNLIKDGWNHPFVIKLSKDKTKITVKSEALENYKAKIKRSANASDRAPFDKNNSAFDEEE